MKRETVTLECLEGSLIVSATKNGRTIRVGQMVQFKHPKKNMGRSGIVAKIHLPVGRYSLEYISVHFEGDLVPTEMEFKDLI